MAHERHEEALNILAKYHANGDANNATVQFEYNEIKDTIALEYQAQKTGSYLDFIRTRGNRYRLMLLISLGIISQYSGNALISNYSNIIYEGAGIKDQAQKTGLNAGENMLKLFVAIGCSMGIDKFGRRPLFLTATVGKYKFPFSGILRINVANRGTLRHAVILPGLDYCCSPLRSRR